MARRCGNCRQVVKGDHNIVTCGREPAPIPTARAQVVESPLKPKESKSTTVTAAYQKFQTLENEPTLVWQNYGKTVSEVVQNPETPATILTTLSLRKNGAEIVKNIVTHPNASAETVLPHINSETNIRLLSVLSRSKHPKVRAAVAAHPKCPLNALARFARDKDVTVRAMVTYLTMVGSPSKDFAMSARKGGTLSTPVLLDLNANLGLGLGNDVVCPYCGRNRGSGHERYTQCPQRVIVSEPILVAPTIVPSMPQAPLLDTTKLLPVFDKKKAITQVEKETFPAYEQWVGNQFAGNLGERGGFEQATVYAATPAGGTVVQNLINTPGIPRQVVEKLELLQQTALFEGKTGLEVLLFQKRAYMEADAPIKQLQKLDDNFEAQLSETMLAGDRAVKYNASAVERTILETRNRELSEFDTIAGGDVNLEGTRCVETYAQKGAKVASSSLSQCFLESNSSVTGSTVTNSHIRGKISRSTVTNSKIEQPAEIFNSTINGANISGIVDDSVLGAGVRVEAGGRVVGVKVDVGTFGGDARVRSGKDVQQYSENGTVYTRYRNDESGGFRNRYTYMSARFDALAGRIVSRKCDPQQDGVPADNKFVQAQSNS